MYRNWNFLGLCDEANPEGGDGAGGAGGNTGDSWRDSLPEDIRDHASIKDYKDVGGMAKSHIELQRMISRSIRVPGEDAGKEDWDKFYNGIQDKAPDLMRKPNADDPEAVAQIMKSLGKPDKNSDYETKVDLGDFNVPVERLDQLREMAGTAGLTKAQFDKLAGAILLSEKEASETVQAKLAESRSALQREWGSAFDERNAKAIAVMQKMGFDASLIEQAKTGAIGADTLKGFYNIADAIGTEGQQVGGQGGGHSGKMTPNEAKEKIEEIMRNRDHPYHKGAGQPNWKVHMDRMVELHRIANPE